MYRDALQQAEVMNKCFQIIFTGENEFKVNDIITIENLIENIKVDKKEVKMLIESQDVRKAQSLSEVSNWIMKNAVTS